MADVSTSAVDGELSPFDTAHLMAGLKAHTARGGAATVAAQFAKQVIGLGATMVMARILLPSDYGLVAMVTAVIGLLTVFKDMGLSVVTVQREVVTQEQVSTLFWINTGAGLLLACITVGLAPLIAAFYAEPRLVPVTCAMAPTFFLGGLVAQHQALLQRQMRFGALALLDVGVLAVYGVVGILLALAGWGYWALVLNLVAGQLLSTVALWVICRWRPGWPARGAGVRPLLAIGGNLVGYNVVNYLARNLDNVLIGRVWGEQQLGLYSKAYNVLLLPVATISAPIATVAVPALSRLQSKPEEYRRLYLQIVSAIAFVTMPIATLMIVASEDLIWVLLGERWIGAVAVFRLLGVSAWLQPIYSTQGWLQASLGHTDRLLRWGLIGSTLIVASFLVGLPFGARGVALAYSCTIVLITWPGQWYAFRDTPIAVADLVRAISGAWIISLLAGGMAFAVVHCIGITDAPMRLATTALLLSLVYCVLHCLLPESRRRMTRIARWLPALMANSN